MSELKIVIEIHERAEGQSVYRWRCPSCPFIVSAASDEAVRAGRDEHRLYEAIEAQR